MKKKSEKVVFFGNEKLATGISLGEPIVKNALVNTGYELEQIITGPITELKPHSAKIAVLVAYGQIIPKKVIDEFPLGIINIHPSLLPLHRGSTPIESVILAGEKETGVSIMQISDKMDAGPVFGYSRLDLKGDESKQNLAETLAEIGAKMLVELLPEIISGTLSAVAQDESKATYDQMIKKSDGQIDWNKTAEQIEREIRAYLGWPGSFTKLNEIDAIISKVRTEKASGIPGKLHLTNKSELAVFCGSGSVVIEKIKPVGKNEMTGAEFLRGYKSRLGDL